MKTLFPLEFFEDLLDFDKSKDLIESFIDDFFVHNQIDARYDDLVVDRELGVITATGMFQDGKTHNWYHGTEVFAFKSDFEGTVLQEYKLAKKKIDELVLKTVTKGVNPTEFLNIQMQILWSLHAKALNSYTNLTIIKQAIIGLKNHIVQKYGVDDLFSDIQNKLQNQSVSFQWDYLDKNEAINSLTKLYKELTSANVILGDKEEFINGFMGMTVKNGIRWLLKTKDKKHTSKPTLFAFVDYLIEEGFIEDIEGKNYNEAILYVFREHDGNQLKNVRQSKSSSTAIISEKIKMIIDNL